MAKRKTPNNNTPVDRLAKKGIGEFDEYYNTLAHQMAPANDESKKRLGIALMAWARDQIDPVDIDDFLDAQGVPPRTYYKWLHKHPELHEANDFAKRRLASLRLKNAQLGKWNWQACRYVLPFYGERYVEHEKFLASLKDDKPQGGTQVVVIEKFKLDDEQK